MAVAAVPAYLGNDFSQASPGLRFGMYLPLWGVDSRVAGQRREERSFQDSNKAAALRGALRLNPSDMKLMAELTKRQSALAAPLATQGRLATLHALAVSPFSTGLGNEHPLENGFAFLNPYGLPYLPGSSVKGVMRQAARELAGSDWGDVSGWNENVIAALFGKAGGDRETDLQRGALMFWDVIPHVAGDALQVELMTPHQSHYYQNGETPHESGQPIPINFVTVPPGSKFVFHVQCDVPFLTRVAPDLARGGRWQQLLGAALEHAFQWLGFGAKTAVGYGAMVKDPEVEIRLEREEQAAQARRKAEQDEATRQQELALMSPTERAIREFLDSRADKSPSEMAALRTALKDGKWTGEIKVAVADHVKVMMQNAGKWKENTEKKNPLKDHDHQDTLLVMKWLAGQ